MSKLKFILLSLLFLTSVSGCQTIKQKTDAIVEKENAKLSEYIGKTSNNLQMDLGKPDEDFKNSKGNLELVYNSKKYGIVCERRFEIDSNLYYNWFCFEWLFLIPVGNDPHKQG